MNFANPYLFDAILDGIPHRFVLVQECEFLQGNDGFSPPRFSVGAVNATRDPRYSAIRQLMEVGVSDSALQIPPSWLMAHQYIYILHEYTDEYGWQYRSQWSALGPPGPKDEPWTPQPTATSRVRRRIWLTTIVPKYELVRAKRLLAENLKIDYGNVKLQGELYRYEKGTLNRSWNKRRFILYHNRIEIYTSSTKKTEVLLQDCEVKMLPDGQIAGAKNVFVVRNLSGTVNLLLSAEDQNTRREWVFAIQYQLAMNSPDVNFVPLEYSPPTGDYPDNRVLVAGDLKLQSPDGQAYDRSFHLLPREVVYYDGDDLRGRIFVEKATVAAEDRNLNFSVTSQSGITLNLAADTPEQKNLWMLSVRKQVQNIDAYNTMKRNLPREEQEDLGQPAVDRISQFYDGNWSAPPVAGEDEEYIRRIFTAPYENHPDHFEFSEELGIRLDKKPKPEASTFKVDVQTRAHTTELIKPSINKYKTMQIVTEDLADIKEIAIPTAKLDKAPEITNPSLNKIKELVIPERKDIRGLDDRKDDSASPASIPTPPTLTPTLPQPTRSLARLKSTMSMLNMSGAVKYLNVKRVLINPRFMLAALKGITHRFVLVLESENRINAPRDIQDTAPLRFTVGGSRASKDPRMVRFDQLIGISNKNPEVQLPAGWFMLHQYVNIIQSNTDDYGWQYRSTWSEGTLNATDEQWVDMCDEQKQVRRRLWMTTVVKRDDFIKAKKMVAEELMKAPDDYILKEDLYLHDPEKGSSATSWQRRNVILYHNKVEFYSGNEKVNDVSLIDCEVKVLSGSEAGGRSFPFCIYHPNGSINVKLDATDKDMRLRWMRALLYQLAIITPEVNFAPFVFGPPTGELPEARIILCGDLEVLDNATNIWDLYQIQMQEQALLVLHRDGHLHGRLLLDHAVVKAREDECEFTVKTQDGLVVHFRALNPDSKFSWVRILKRQIHFAEYAHGRRAHDESSVRQIVKHYQDSEWIGREGEYGEDDAHMRMLRQNFKATLMSTWSGERGSETPTASSLVTEQWRITQQNAAMKLNATSVSSDITQVGKYPDLSAYAETETGSQSTDPVVKTITRVVRTTTTTTTTNNTTNVVTDDGKGTKTIITGSTMSKDVTEAVEKQADGTNKETVVRTMHFENATGAPVDVKNIPIPPNLLSKFGKTKSPTSSSVRITELPSDDSEVVASPLRNQSQQQRLTNGGGVASVPTSGNATPLSPMTGGTSSAIVSEPSSTKSAAFAASEPSSVKSSGIAGIAGGVGIVSEPTSVKVATTTVAPTVEATTVHRVAVVSEPVALKTAAEAAPVGSPSTVGPSPSMSKVESVGAPLSASKVATGGLSSVQGIFPAVGAISTQESETYTPPPPPAYEAATTLASPQAKAAAAVTASPSRAEPVSSTPVTTPVAGTTSSKIVITRSATGSKPIGADSASQKAPEFTTITLRGVPGAQSSPQVEEAKRVSVISPKMSVASVRSATTNNDFDDLDDMLNVRKEDVEYHDDDDEDDGPRRSPVHMHTTSQYFTEEEEDKGEDFEEAARAIAQLAESNNKESHGDAQQKLRTLNQMTMAYMRRLGYVEGLSPTHAYIPMNHLNDYDQAYVVENGFFRDGEDDAKHAYIPLEALRRSLMSLEGGAAPGVDIKKVTLRHVPTNLLIRRGIDKPAEPESELLREARRRATTRRFNIDDAEGAGASPNNESEEPEFLREARRRQQSRRVSLPDENTDLTPSSKGDEAEPEFLREAKRRQASRRMSLESDANAARDEATGEVENEAVREARRREQRRREMEEEAARKAREEAEARRHVEEEARRRAEQEEAARQAEKAARIAALEAEVARKKALDEAAKKQADEEALRKIAEEKARKLLEVGVIEVNTTQVPMQVDVDRPSMGEYDHSFMSPNAQSLRTPSNDDANEYLSPAGRARLPPSGPSSANHRRNSAISLSNPASFDLEEELSQVSKRLRPVAADDMSVGSYQRDDASISSQKRRAVRLKNMSTEYLQRKGYLLPGNDFATIPLTDLRSSDQKLVTENGFLDEDGTHAIIPLKNTDTRPATESAESGKLIEQVSLKPVARDGLPPPRPGLQREDSNILKTVQLRPVDRRNTDDRTNQRAPDSTVSPLVQVKQKLRRVSVTSGGDGTDGASADATTTVTTTTSVAGAWSLASSSRDDDDNASVTSPFKGVKLRSVKTSHDEDIDGGHTASSTGNSLGVAATAAPGGDFDDDANVGEAVHSVQDLRARNVRSNSIMGKIQKFEKTNSVPSTPTGSSSGGFGSSTSEVRGISRSTSIAAKRNSEPVVPPSPSAAGGSGSASKPPAGRPTSGNLSASKPPSGSSSPRAGDKAAATPDRAGASAVAGSGSTSPTPSGATTPTSASTGEAKPRGTTVTIAAAASTKPPNPLLQRKKSMTDKGLGAPKKSFRF